MVFNYCCDACEGVTQVRHWQFRPTIVADDVLWLASLRWSDTFARSVMLARGLCA